MSEKRKSRLACCTVIGLLAVVLYVLSFGPALWLVERGSLSMKRMATIYEPCLSLDFRAPQAVQDSVMANARLFHAGSTLTELREGQSWQTYPVDVLDYRLVNKRGVDETARRILAAVTFTIEPATWDELGGPGRAIFDEPSRSLRIRQTRKVHAALASRLASFRAWKRFKQENRERNLPAQNRIDCESPPSGWRRGWCLKEELLDHAVIINHTDKPILDDRRHRFSGIDELFAFLDQQSRETLHGGVFWSDSQSGPDADVADRLSAYCRRRNLDLFIELPFKGKVFGQVPTPVIQWVNRASDSDYYM